MAKSFLALLLTGAAANELKVSNATESWVLHADVNCYQEHGSMKDVDPVGTPLAGVVGEKDCEAACDLHRQCYAALVGNDGACYRRGPIRLVDCDDNTDFTLFIRKGPRPPLPPSPPPTTPAPHYESEIFGGIMKGLLADSDVLAPCEDDGATTILQFVTAIKDLKAGKVEDMISDLAAAFGAISPMVKECAIAKADAKKLEDDIKGLTREQALNNFRTHRTEILGHLATASDHHDKAVAHADPNEYTLMGVEVGDALRRIIEVDALVV